MLLNLSIIIFCALFAVLCWKKIDWAVALTVFMLPSYLIRFRLFGIPMTLLEAMILLLLITYLLRIYKSHEWREIQIGNYKWPILLLLIAATASVFFASDKMAALGIWKAYFVEPILFLIVLIGNYISIRININANLRMRESTNKIIVALGASALIVAIYAVIQKFTGWGIPNEFWADEATRRVTSFFGYPNAVGLYLAPITILFIGLLVDYAVKKTSKHQNTNKIIGGNIAKQIAVLLFYCFVISSSFAAIFFAQSEGGLIAIAGGIVLFFLLYPNKRIRIISLVSLVLLVLLVSLFPLARNYAAQKLTLSDFSGQIRQEQWKETWNMLKDGRLISGAGLANYQAAVKDYHKSGITITAGGKTAWQPTEIYLYPHNFILNFWSETGLAGVIAMIWLVVLFIKNYWRVEKENRKYYLVLICVLATILIHGAVDAPYFKNDLSVMWWLLIAGSIFLTNKKCNTNIQMHANDTN